MTAEHVLVKCDVYCDWQDQPPVYRLFVGGELFAERTYIWREQYLEEMIPVYAEPGEYKIHYELVPPSTGSLVTKNLRVSSGPGTIVNNVLKVEANEST
jgi:hypothetical protein